MAEAVLFEGPERDTGAVFKEGNKNGKLFATGTDSIDDEKTGYKINAWKCLYHNARAAMEIVERARKMNARHNEHG